MTKFNYSQMLATADRLINQFGQTGTIQKFDASGKLTTSYSCTFVQLEYGNRDRDGDLIRINDRKIIMSAVGVPSAPTPEDRHVMADGTVAQIVTVRPLSPSGLPLFYELQVRS